ncbi:MAG: BrnA antitoxin family protein [Mogibacterium sp.]|nr:BrnA antitoxin family protein [Mogibacterium sp.]
MAVKKKIDPKNPPTLTEEQLKLLKELERTSIVFDEDNPPLSDEQLSKFKKVSEINRAKRNKQTVTLRLSPRALNKAKALGKGYTSVLSRILEEALEDNELIEKYL